MATVRTVVVVTGSAAARTRRRSTPPSAADRIVAADGGLDHARAAGLVPDVLVGDLDSVSADGLAWATANIAVERHPTDKAATDTELALAVRRGDAPPTPRPRSPGSGDRIDHAIAALGALGRRRPGRHRRCRGLVGHRPRPRRPPADARVDIGRPPGTTFSAARPPRTVPRRDGHRLALAAAEAELGPLVGLGVSNEVLQPPCRVDVAAGVVTVIVPGAQP